MSKTNPRLDSLIAELKAKSRGSDANVWQDIADRLEKPRRTHAEVNLGRIERYAREDETVVVPGKVLGSGVLQKTSLLLQLIFHRLHKQRSNRSETPSISVNMSKKILKEVTYG